MKKPIFTLHVIATASRAKQEATAHVIESHAKRGEAISSFIIEICADYYETTTEAR